MREKSGKINILKLRKNNEKIMLKSLSAIKNKILFLINCNITEGRDS